MRYLLILIGVLVLGGCSSGAPATPPAVPSPALSVTPPTLAPTLASPTSAPIPTEPPIAEAPTDAPAVVPPTVIPSPTPVRLTGTFVNGEVTVNGSYSLDVATNLLSFSDDFRVDAGPDLYVILSGVGDVSLPFATFSQQALDAPLLRLGPLASFSGAQSYSIPEGTGLAVYQSVVIWCNTYSVEFAAAPLRP